MSLRVILLACLLLVQSLSLFGQVPSADDCGKDSLVDDGLLQRTLEKTAGQGVSVRFGNDDLVCSHKKYMARALKQTFRRDLVGSASDYSFALLENDGHAFSIERLVFKNKQAADFVHRILSRRKTRNLQIESLVYYDAFVSGNNLILFVADKKSFDANKSAFTNIRNTFLEAHQKLISNPKQ